MKFLSGKSAREGRHLVLPLIDPHKSREFCIFHFPMDESYGPGNRAKRNWNEDELGFFGALIDEYAKWCWQKDQCADLSDLQCPAGFGFLHTTLDGDIDISRAVIMGPVIFEGSTCHGELVATGAEFEKLVDLKAASFERVDFDRAKFLAGIRCLGMKTGEDCSFCHADFFGRADFHLAEFGAGLPVDFSFASFHGRAFFLETCFDGGANFSNTEFKGEMMFAGAEFSGDADFSASQEHLFSLASKQAEGIGIINFSEASFKGTVSFENRIFAQSANFIDCNFESAPIFHGGKIHQGTEFPTRSYFSDTEAKSANAYTTLKLAMGALKRSREEGMFYALEQKCLRKDSDTPLSARIASLIYEFANDYGQSYVRPLIWLALLTFLAVPIYVYFGSWGVADNSDIGLKAWTFSLEQIFRPFYAWRTDLASAIGVTSDGKQLAVKIVATVQSAFSIGLIALAVLALRWRFRRP